MCSMMSEIPSKKSLNTIGYQISEEIENILLNEKGEPKLDATVKWYHILKQKQKNPITTWWCPPVPFRRQEELCSPGASLGRWTLDIHIQCDHQAHKSTSH